jgi:ribonucleotide monophosphatase NagD (HAD superfamily)
MFCARILQGGYNHHVYAETLDKSAQADAFVLGNNGFKALGMKIGLEKVGQDALVPGSGYVLSSKTFHTLSDFKDDTITLVVRSQNPSLVNTDPLFVSNHISESAAGTFTTYLKKKQIISLLKKAISISNPRTIFRPSLGHLFFHERSNRRV